MHAKAWHAVHPRHPLRYLAMQTPFFTCENRTFHCRYLHPLSPTATCAHRPVASDRSHPARSHPAGSHRSGVQLNDQLNALPYALCRPKESNNHLSRCSKLSLHRPYAGCAGGSVRREVGGSLLCGRKSWCPIFGVEVGAGARARLQSCKQWWHGPSSSLHQLWVPVAGARSGAQARSSPPCTHFNTKNRASPLSTTQQRTSH